MDLVLRKEGALDIAHSSADTKYEWPVLDKLYRSIIFWIDVLRSAGRCCRQGGKWNVANKDHKLDCDESWIQSTLKRGEEANMRTRVFG